MARTMRILTLAVLLAVVCGTTAFANGFNLNGVGSKAIGMGGAFIGLADDGSALFWNPAGVSQTEKTTIWGFEMNLIPSGTYVWKYDPLKVDINAKTQSKIYPAGAFTFLKPVGKKLVLGVGVYAPAGTGARWDGEDFLTFPGVGGKSYTWDSYMAVITGAAAASYKITDKASVGATLNYNRAKLTMKRPALGQYEEDLSASALGATLGLLLKPHEKVNLGFTFRTASDLEFEGETTMQGTAAIPPVVLQALQLSGVPTTSQGERKATWPMWVGAGLALKATDKLTFTADVQYSNWKKVGVVPMVFSEPSWETLKNPPAALLAHPQLGAPLRSLAMAFDQSFALKWKDAVQYRMGVEYVAGKDLALRAGYYYDPNPSPLETLNVLLPERTYNVGTVGVGKKFGKLSADLCLEVLFGKDAVAPTAGFPTTVKMPGTHGMRILAPNFSIGYVF